MMILITYDVEVSSETGATRLRKVARECLNYGQRVQNSVFECVISETDFVFLKNRLNSIIDKEKDSIRFYFLGKHWHGKKECIGRETSYDLTSELII